MNKSENNQFIKVSYSELQKISDDYEKILRLQNERFVGWFKIFIYGVIIIAISFIGIYGFFIDKTNNLSPIGFVMTTLGFLLASTILSGMCSDKYLNPDFFKPALAVQEVTKIPNKSYPYFISIDNNLFVNRVVLKSLNIEQNYMV